MNVDSSGNESPPAHSVSSKALNRNKPEKIELRLTKNYENKTIEIKWAAANFNIESVLIYRSVDSEPLTQYVTRPANEGQFNDNNIKQQHSYKYVIKGMLANGVETEFSNTKVVEY